MIALEGVSVSVGTFQLHAVDLHVPPGGYGLLIGPTGSGKTTLLETIAGHRAAAGGRILLDGTDVTREPPERRGVGFVYQSYHLFPHLSVRQNIGYGLRVVGAGARVDHLARVLQLTSLLDRRVTALSGGEQQRVALARAVAPRPRILLLDEPFAAVDPDLRQALRREIQLIRETERVTTLHVTHDIEDALRLGDTLLVLGDGRVVQSGPPADILRYPVTPFVARFVGAGNVLAGRIRRATDTPETASDPFTAWFETGNWTFEVVARREGEAHALLRAEDLLVSRTELPAYPRNRFDATVERVETVGPMATVFLRVQGVTVSALVTAQTVDDQSLTPGSRVSLAFKATAVHLF